MKKTYEMTEEDLTILKEACKPVPMIAINCGRLSSPQENANAAWERLGKKMGFYHMTVQPAGKGGERFFIAEERPYECEEIENANSLVDGLNVSATALLNGLKGKHPRSNECKGFEIEEGSGDYSGCDQSNGDCLVCGK